MLNGIFKLADIPRPGVVEKNTHGMLGDSLNVLTGFTVLPVDEMSRQKRDVFFTYFEGRQDNGKDFQPIVQIISKMPLLDAAVKIPVGGRHDPDIDLAGF